MQSGEQNRSKAEAQYRVLVILWMGMIFSLGMFFVLTFLIPQPTTAASDSVVVWFAVALGSFLALTSFFVKRVLLERAVQRQQPDLVNSAYTVAFALTEAAAVFGLFLFFISATRYHYFLFAFSAVCLLLHFPKRDSVLAAVYKGQ
jgi:TRAP-type uncharacterized transport system fused permease subunit